MKTPQFETITPERVETILSSYGADAEKWPEDERLKALALIEITPRLQTLWQEAKALDDIIFPAEKTLNSTQADPELVSKILNVLPEQETPANQQEKFPTQALPARVKNFLWQHPMQLAASVALAFAVIIAIDSNTNTPDNTATMLSQQALDAWFWEDITNESETIFEPEPLDFMSMVELEQVQE